MKYRFYMNDKEMSAKEIRKQYGKQLLDTMIRAMGYKPKGENKDKSA